MSNSWTSQHRAKLSWRIVTCAQFRGCYTGFTIAHLQQCDRDSQLVPCGAGDICNPYINGPHINLMNAAVIEFKKSVSAELEIEHSGPITRVTGKESFSPGLRLNFAGQTSGMGIAEVGGLGVTYQMQHGNSSDLYCVKGLFEIRKPAPVPILGIGPAIPHLFNSPMKAGDSGAWLLDQYNQNYGWIGQVMAEDSVQGYALFSEDVILGQTACTIRSLIAGIH